MLLGSHARGRARKYSDWDIGVFGHPKPLTGMAYLPLKNAVEEWSEDLVREVDLVNLNQAPAWFLLAQAPPHFLGGNHEAYTYFLGVLDGIKHCEQAATSHRAS